jgi:hypothetical protein
MRSAMSGQVKDFVCNPRVLVACVIMSIALGGCASHKVPTVPNWGGSNAPPIAIEAPPPNYRPQTDTNQAPPPPVISSRRSFTEGCTGGFSVRDARTNREISSGRAYNTGSGFIVLDSAGRQVRALSSGSATSVLFLPDCNCRSGTQTGAVSPNQTFAAQAPSGNACQAG